MRIATLFFCMKDRRSACPACSGSGREAGASRVGVAFHVDEGGRLAAEDETAGTDFWMAEFEIVHLAEEFYFVVRLPDEQMGFGQCSVLKLAWKWGIKSASTASGASARVFSSFSGAAGGAIAMFDAARLGAAWPRPARLAVAAPCRVCISRLSARAGIQPTAA